MADDPDIIRAAKFMIARHGRSAVLAAAKRANDLVGNGQPRAGAIWLRIGIAAQQIQAQDATRPTFDGFGT